MHIKSLLAGCAALFAVAQPAQAQDWSSAGDEDSPAIYWDEWGVAHITAAGDEDAAYALGWAQARGRPDQLIELLVQGRGTAASLWGESYVENDILVITAGIPDSIPALMAALETEERARLEAFATGINAYFNAHPEALPAERRRGLPITPEDIVAHAQSGIYLSFVAPRELFRVQQLRSAAQAPGEPGDRGSNGWAVAPSRSESGNALLLMNPHLPWDGMFTWFESHVIADGNNRYGVGLLGHPQQTIMFNQNLGWTHTVNRLDNADMYAVELTPSGGYMFDGEERALEMHQHVLTIAQPDGSSIEQNIRIFRTVHGPVVAQDGNRVYALRIAGMGDTAYGNTFAQYAQMAEARTREEFEAALARLQNPMFNTIYADSNGEILFVSNGLHPVRGPGDADYWDGVIDGNTAETLWTDYHPYESLMRIANPASGFLQNANETGFTATLPVALDPADFPSDWIQPDMRTRPQHSIELLRDDTSITFDEIIAYAHDTRLTFADNVLDDLLRAARNDGRAEALRAVEVLGAWDRRTNAESRGAALFVQWANAFLDTGQFDYDRRWSFEAPEQFSAGISDVVEGAAVDALVATVQRADAAGIPLDLPWGMLARVPDGDGGTLPSDLAPGGLGAFRVGQFDFATGVMNTSVNGGTGWVAAIEFADTPRAQAILPYGNFEHRPAAVRSQYQLLSEGLLRDVNFTPEAVREAAVYGEVLERD
ncbi:penicillin acylase family protein [Erythrobacter alti]|uniref:penicillin acylase family protein n=1 Tax=Erythrobacter alti TaxID=1896145 RepID=UPI0030F496E6